MPSRKKQPTGLESGVWLHESGLLGTSPDGLVGDNNDVEAKCPYTQRHLTIEDGDKYLLPEKKKKKKGRKDFAKARPCLLATGNKCRASCS